MKVDFTRRGFVRTAAAGMAVASSLFGRRVQAAAPDKPALLGGTPAHTGGWRKWPDWRQAWESDILQILRSGSWYRGGDDGRVRDFELAYAKLLGAQSCLAVSSGTTALMTALHVMGVDAGDEVIVSPYTFIATYNAILSQKALPVFADTDPETLTMDPASIESRITDRTRAIVPVHIFGMPCDMDPINAVAGKHQLAVVEDACQAWLAEYKGKKCGTVGDIGCFSFQNSKHLPSGEGGAITSNDETLIDRCNSYHNCGRAVGSVQGSGFFTQGLNFRMMHMQASMLIQQIDKLVEETKLRQKNADYLTAGLKEIPGVTPVRLPENSRAAWHLYPIRYDAEQFNGLALQTFAQAMRAEGVPCGSVYQEQYHDGLLDEAIQSRGFQRLFGKQRLSDYRDSFKSLKGNAKVCATTVAISQRLLLGKQKDMDDILNAIRKIQAHSGELAKQAS